MRPATPSLPLARIELPGQLIDVAAPYCERHTSLVASRCLVKANVVPLPSWRTTVAIVRSGSLTPGLVRAIRGSFQRLICPRKVPASASREGLRSDGRPDMLEDTGTLP